MNVNKLIQGLEQKYDIELEEVKNEFKRISKEKKSKKGELGELIKEASYE